jgi:hypothetical protein
MRARRPGLALHLGLHQRIGNGAAQDSVRRGLLLELHGPGQRIATRRVEPLRVLLQRADHYRARVQPQAERHAVRLPSQALAQLESRQHCPSGMILVCHRCPK